MIVREMLQHRFRHNEDRYVIPIIIFARSTVEKIESRQPQNTGVTSNAKLFAIEIIEAMRRRYH